MANTEQLLQEVLNDLKAVLRPEDYQNAAQDLAAGEPGVAFETVCAQLHEYDLRISQASYKKLREIGESMYLGPETWKVLAPLVD